MWRVRIWSLTHDEPLPNAHVAAPLPRHHHHCNGDGGRPAPPPRCATLRTATTRAHHGSRFAEAATTNARRIAPCAVRDAVATPSTNAAADSAVTERRAMAMPPRLPDDATRDLLTESLKHASLATVGRDDMAHKDLVPEPLGNNRRRASRRSVVLAVRRRWRWRWRWRRCRRSGGWKAVRYS